MDDAELTYDVLRDNNTWVNCAEGEVELLDPAPAGVHRQGLAAGSHGRYQVRITDSNGNMLWSPVSNTVTVGNGVAERLRRAVVADGAEHLWRLGEPSGNTALDWAGFDDLTMNGGYTRGADGAIIGDSDMSTTFGGTSGYRGRQLAIPGPDVFSLEAWFRTTTNSGGKIVSFGNDKTGTSDQLRPAHLHGAAGRIYFGVYNNGSYTVTRRSLNDGQWHQAVGTIGPTA